MLFSRLRYLVRGGGCRTGVAGVAHARYLTTSADGFVGYVATRQRACGAASQGDEAFGLSRAMHSGSPQVRPLPRQTRPHEQRAARLASHASWSPSTIEPSGCVTLYTRFSRPPRKATY